MLWREKVSKDTVKMQRRKQSLEETKKQFWNYTNKRIMGRRGEKSERKRGDDE